MTCHPRATCHNAGCCHLANSVSWFQSYVSHCRVLPPGEFNGMSSQSHVSHCRVLPLGEFTVMIPDPHNKLKGAVTWWHQCHDRATLQGVRIPSAILKIVFHHIFLFLMLFRLWRAVAFLSSPLLLLIEFSSSVTGAWTSFFYLGFHAVGYRGTVLERASNAHSRRFHAQCTSKLRVAAPPPTGHVTSLPAVNLIIG